jgi:hypothetical protein
MHTRRAERMIRPMVPDTAKKRREMSLVVLITERIRVEGEVHVRPGERLTDFMNTRDNQFIAVTHARVYDSLEGKLVFTVDFLDINRDSIIIAFPVANSAQQPEATVI